MAVTVPRVSVIMSVHNAGEFLREAIDSILNQSLVDLEFIIVDDCSNDGSADILASYGDKRIRLLRNDANLGLTRSLNSAMSMAGGDYIARMDADDISLPRRLERQVAFMDSHPETGICGTWIRYVGTGRSVLRLPTDHNTLASSMVFGPQLVHPSVMLRRSLVESLGLRYDPEFSRAQDFDLWWRALPDVHLANFGEVLLHYRLHGDQARNAHKDEQQQSAGTVRRRVLQSLGIEPTDEEMALHQAVATCVIDGLQNPFARIDDWLCRLLDANRARRLFPEKEFAHVILRQWLLLGKKACDRDQWNIAMLSHADTVRKSGAGWGQVAVLLGRMAFGR